jgi:hypothetical protein
MDEHLDIEQQDPEICDTCGSRYVILDLGGGELEITCRCACVEALA